MIRFPYKNNISSTTFFKIEKTLILKSMYICQFYFWKILLCELIKTLQFRIVAMPWSGVIYFTQQKPWECQNVDTFYSYRSNKNRIKTASSQILACCMVFEALYVECISFKSFFNSNLKSPLCQIYLLLFETFYILNGD